MSGNVDKHLISKIQQSNDIIDLIAEHVSLTKKGREMVGMCPFHDDHRPSMYVNPEKQIFKCFACGAGGDVYKFVQMRENLTFPQAIERLAERAGIKIDIPKFSKQPKNTFKSEQDPNEMARVNNWAARYFHSNLCNKEKGQSAREYIKERKINDSEIAKWQIGLALTENDLLKAARSKNIPLKLLEQAGLVTKKGVDLYEDKFVNRLMFTIQDVSGRVIGFGGRTLDGNGPKYLNSPATVLFDKSNCLYGLNHARDKVSSTGTAVIVEGYTDCIMAHQFGCENVIATLGTSFTDGHGRILKRYAKKIVLLFDNDTAGIEAANRALEVCLTQKVDIKLASVPQGKDPCDFILAAGKENFDKLVDEATDVFEFKWNRLTSTLNSQDTMVDHKVAVEQFLQTIATAIGAGNLTAIDTGLIVNRLSRIIGLDNKQITAELEKRIKRSGPVASNSRTTHLENQKAASTKLSTGLLEAALREILEVVLNEPRFFESVKKTVTIKDFETASDELKEVGKTVFEILNSSPRATLVEILSQIEDVKIAGMVVQLSETGQQKGNLKKRLTDSVSVVEKCKTKINSVDIKESQDQKEYLKQVCENAAKQNPHSLGMI